MVRSLRCSSRSDSSRPCRQLEGLIMGQIHYGEAQVPGFHTVNRRYVYAALHWCTNHHADICEKVRELMGGGVFQMPADVSVLDDPAIA